MLLQSPSVGSRFRLQQHVAFLFILLSEGCPLNRPRIEDGRGQGASVQVLPQNLVTVDVPRKDGGETPGEVGASDHIRSMAERMVGRSYRGSLNAVMHAKETEVCLLATPSGLLQHLGELATNGLSMVGETGEGNPNASRPHSP